MLNAEDAQTFEEDLEYILNGCQIFSLGLRAVIEPAALQISMGELDFDFAEAQSLQPWVQKVSHSASQDCCSKLGIGYGVLHRVALLHNLRLTACTCALQNLVIRNEQPFSCAFRWALSEEAGAWTVEPQEGNVGPNSSLPAVVRWMPPSETPPGEHMVICPTCPRLH